MSDQLCFMGVDPGQNGGVAFYWPSRPKEIAVFDLPFAGKELNCPELALLIRQHNPSFAIIESVHAMPKQGVSSSFNFGMSYGMVRGVVAACRVPQVLVTPQKWKKAFSLSADKEKSRLLAILTFPESSAFSRKKDDGRAEAALIAVYGATKIRAELSELDVVHEVPS